MIPLASSSAAGLRASRPAPFVDVVLLRGRRMRWLSAPCSGARSAAINGIWHLELRLPPCHAAAGAGCRISWRTRMWCRSSSRRQPVRPSEKRLVRRCPLHTTPAVDPCHTLLAQSAGMPCLLTRLCNAACPSCKGAATMPHRRTAQTGDPIRRKEFLRRFLNHASTALPCRHGGRPGALQDAGERPGAHCGPGKEGAAQDMRCGGGPLLGDAPGSAQCSG